MTRTRRGLVPAIATCALVAGCVASAPYPADWAPVDPRPPACAALGGVYENGGVVYQVRDLVGSRSYPRVEFLARLFFQGEGRTLSDARAPTRLRLDASTPNRLTVVALFDDGREVPVTLAEEKGDYACRDGRIELSSTGMEFIPIALMVGGTKTTHALSRAADGALIVESHAVSAGTALIWIPLGFSDRSWGRFPAAADAGTTPK